MQQRFYYCSIDIQFNSIQNSKFKSTKKLCLIRFSITLIIQNAYQ